MTDTSQLRSPTPAAALRVLVVGRGVVPIKVGCGGAELAMYQLSKTLALVGHDVTVVADVVEADFPTTPGLRFVSPKGRLHRLAARLPGGFAGWVVKHLVGNLASVARARELLRTESFDLVHAHANLAAYLLSRLSPVPVVYTEHDSTPWSCRYRRLHERLIRRLIYRVVNVPAFRRAARVATICESLRLELLDRFGIAATNVMTILNGADFNVFQPETSRPSASPFERYCLFVGRLTPRKAPDVLLAALAEAPGACCVFAGDGPMRPRLETLAAKLGVADRVAFIGNVSPAELAPLYAGADLLVIPSVSEGTPLVAFEAMACGTPVLSSRIAGLPELVHDWSTGFLVKPGDVGQLAIAIRFLTADPEALARMGAEAQRRVRKRFLWPNVAREYLALYRSLLPAHGRVAGESADEPELEPELEPERVPLVGIAAA
jgi:glycosyltransferase involved in cell wall biosynthesis